MVRATSPSSASSSSPIPDSRRAGAAAKGKPKPKSAARAAANRANAQRSTGPRTAEGKARSRMNALRHGLCARAVLLPGEDRAEYEAFARAYVDDLRPVGVVQEMLAARVASLAWALTRLPDAAVRLVGRGEAARANEWFVRRALHLRGYNDLCAANDKAYRQAIERGESPNRPPPLNAQTFDDWLDKRCMEAIEEGNPPPMDPREPAGVVADAMAGDETLAAVMKLEEHERRLWSAMLAALRALERRQKHERRGGRGDEDAEPALSEGVERPTDAVVSPEVGDAGAAAVTETTNAPARNEANVGQENPEADQEDGHVAPTIAGAERTQYDAPKPRAQRDSTELVEVSGAPDLSASPGVPGEGITPADT